ncbi:MarR family transcriptional regulator [Anaerococcus sp. NML200537]|uniref:MarR family winged helix-turn-helix transcriptional regulator n=1 Tax=Anaerococcus kampingae TaxID=3115614 RepID=A0ABW9MAJ7_9FIRM|nr:MULTISPECIES: MarR family transcriptional regulator [unclassified Anaerococcus]MCW6701943.1 MarR family transcriptional regulator [Anaerococcus sp. NML200537]
MKKTILEDIITMANINFYTKIYSGFEKREATLSYTESMVVNIIDSLEKPTVNELVKILGISQPNISYKINTLVSKGYVEKVQSKEDGREFILRLTDRFKTYKKIAFSSISEVMDRLEEKLSKEDMENIYKSLGLIKAEMKNIND